MEIEKCANKQTNTQTNKHTNTQTNPQDPFNIYERVLILEDISVVFIQNPDLGGFRFVCGYRTFDSDEIFL